MTTRTEIDLSADGPLWADGAPLTSGVGLLLQNNAQENALYRVNRAGITYVPGQSAETGSDPPAAFDFDVSRYADDDDSPSAGLTINSPPNGPVFLPIAREFPLSPYAETLRVIVGCRALAGPVDVYAFARIGGAVMPFPPRVTLDDRGVASFQSAVPYTRITTATPTDERAMPVVLDIPVGEWRTETLARSVDGAPPMRCEVWLAVLSTDAGEAITATVDFVAPRYIDAGFGNGPIASVWLLRDANGGGQQMHTVLASANDGLIHPGAPSGTYDVSVRGCSYLQIFGISVREVTP